MRNLQLSKGHILLIVLMMLHLLPVWVFTFFPTQDGASHIYNSYVLKEYHKHENYRLREVYELNPTLFPNWTSHVLFLCLMYIFPPIICEKIILTLCIGLLPLSLFYFLNGIQKRNLAFGFVGFIYAYNYLLHMGFYNFVLSMSLFFFTLGYWWRIKEKLSVANIVIMYVLLLTTYLTHFHSYVLLVLSLTFLAIYLVVYDILKGFWGTKSKSMVRVLRFKEALINQNSLIAFLGVLLPAYFICLSHYLFLADKHGHNSDYKGIEWLMDYFFSMKSLVAFRDEHILIGNVLLGVFVIALILTVINRIVQCYKDEVDAKGERIRTQIVTQLDGFLLISTIITVLYFSSPWSGFSGGWINDRFHLYIFLVLLPFFSINQHRYINYGIVGILIVLSLFHLGYNVHTYTMLNRDIKEALSLDGMDEKHTILMSNPGEWKGFSNSLGFEPKYVEPFGHIECFLVMNKGISYLNNYEANTDHFPLRYKRKDLIADFAIIWRTEYHDIAGLEEEYELIDSNDYNRLYRRKRVPTDIDLWNGVVGIAFDMQPHDANTAQGHIPVNTDTFYQDNGFGWLTQSIRTDYKSSSDDTRMYLDSIFGEEDGVFRVTLPNGTYKVICFFNASESEPVEINLIANGEKKIERLKIPKGNNRISREYQIHIDDEHLTQVIYTRGKGQYKRWGWSSCTILLTDTELRQN